MNRRTLKKHCKRAMDVLIHDYGFRPDHFVRSTGEECVDAPPGMERRFMCRSGALEPGPLKGTWLLFEQVSYEYDEWDYALPSEVLRDLEFWATFEPSAEDLAELGRPPLSTTGRGSDE